MENQKEFIESLFSKKDRKKLWVLPAVTNKEIDLERERIVTWLHPSGHIGYVVYNDGEKISAFMMERLAEKSASNKACMCSWCLSVKSARNMTIFSRKLSETTSNGVMLCSDLNCLNSINNPGANAMRESLNAEEKRQRYYKNVESYMAKYL
ncbi:MAG: FBP domain-containing protein [Alphaproteobacteria bacterium]|nr:FBP domain-containing protein [Alphaproteobacteria bacterium]